MQRSLVIPFDSLTDSCPFKNTRFCEVRRRDSSFVKVPHSWTRIKDHLQAEGNEGSRHFQWGAAVPTSQSKDFRHRQGVCMLVKEQKPALEHTSMTSMWLIWNCHRDCKLFGCSGPWNACSCRVVWIRQRGRLFLLVVNWTSKSYFFFADDPHFFQDESNTDLFVRTRKTDLYLSQCGFLALFHVTFA